MILWFVYIALCSDGTFYTGIAKDVQKRIQKHNAGRGAKYTKTRLPIQLLIQSQGFSHGDALRHERAIKALPKERKLKALWKLK